MFFGGIHYVQHVIEAEVNREIADYTEYVTGERPDGSIEVLTNLIGKVTAPLGASLLGCFTGGATKWSIMLLYETGILLLALAPFVPGSI